MTTRRFAIWNVVLIAVSAILGALPLPFGGTLVPALWPVGFGTAALATLLVAGALDAPRGGAFWRASSCSTSSFRQDFSSP